MQRTLGSRCFLTLTAVGCALAVGLATWTTTDSPGGMRVLAALIALGGALGVMLLVAWVLAFQGEPPRAVPAPPGEPSDQVSTARTELTLRLDQGQALRGTLEPDVSDVRVRDWIEGTRQSIQQHRPGVLGFFDALHARPYADDGERLDAHVGRLTTILRDFL